MGELSEQPLTKHIQELVADGGYVTKWILLAEVARPDGNFSLWHASDGCAPWDAEGLIAYGGRALVSEMDSDDDEEDD